MHPRKNRPVLFEVVARTQKARPRSAPPPAPAAAPSPTTSTVAPTPAVRPARENAPGTPRDWRRFFRLEGRDIRVVLSRPQAALAAVGLVVLLMAAFFVGRYSGKALPPQNIPIEDVLSAGAPPEPPRTAAAAPTPGRGRSTDPVVTPLVQPLQEPPLAKPSREPAPPAPTQVEQQASDETPLARDSFYVVVQHFRLRDRERADAAQQFLRSNGVECAIRAGTDLQLVATEAFASEQQAESLRKRIVDIGKQYRESGGGYDFASAKARKF